MNNDSPFHMQFEKPYRAIDVSVQLPSSCTTLAAGKSLPGPHNIFIDLATLYQEDERLRSVLDKYDIMIFAPHHDGDGAWKPTIFFETAKAKLAREVFAYGG